MDQPSAGRTWSWGRVILFFRDVTVYIRMGHTGYTGLGYGLRGLDMGSGGPEKKIVGGGQEYP